MTEKTTAARAIEAIRSLIAAYAEACDGACFEDWRKTFADDGSLEVAGDLYKGADLDLLMKARVAVKRQEQLEGRRTRHHLTSQRITLGAGDEARSWTYFQLLRGGAIEETGVYHDRVIRDAAGNWKFAHRDVMLEFRSPAAPDAERPKPLG